MNDLVALHRLRNNIKHKLSSPDSCSEDVVEAVRRLLDVQAEYKQQCGKSPPQKAPARARQTVGVKARRSSKQCLHPTKAPPCTPIIHEDPHATLGDKTRMVFATELVNIVLRTLNVAAKSPCFQSAHKKTTENCGLTRKSTATIDTRNGSDSQLPANAGLKPRSVNCMSKVSEDAKIPKPLASKNGAKSLTYLSSITAIAECGGLAVECLRKQPLLPHTWQLEHGMIAFIGSLLSLGLTEPATKELRKMKSQLEMRLGIVGRSDIPPNPNLQQCTQPPLPEFHDNIADLIHFENIDVQSPVLPHVLSHQLLVLKLAVALRQTKVVEALLKYLQRSSVSSPINLLIGFATFPDMKERAASQLEIVAQLVLSLSSSPVQTMPLELNDHNAKVSAETCFRLQTLGFEAHVLWRRLAGHHGNPDQEIIKPFQRALFVYTRNSSITPEEIYTLAATSYELLIERINEYRKHVSGLECVQTSLRLAILLHLSGFAQKAGLWDEAHKSTKNLLQTKESGECPCARKKIIAMRLATVKLHRAYMTQNNEDIKIVLQSTVGLFDLDLTATVSDFILLLHEAKELRCVVMVMWKQSSRTISPSSQLENLSLNDICQVILNSNLRLLSRCFELCETRQINCTETKVNELKQKAVEIVHSSIESVLLWYNNLKFLDSGIWSTADKALQTCLLLLRRVHVDQVDNLLGGDDKIASQTPLYCKISQVYWTLYNISKVNCEMSDITVKALERSCESLDDRSRAERKAAALASKFGKLGQIFQSLGRNLEARGSLVKSIQINIECGALSEIESTCQNTSFRSVPTQSTEFTVLCHAIERLLHLIARYHTGESSEPLFYDDELLSTEQRICLLESQLKILAKERSSTVLMTLRELAVPGLYKVLNELYVIDSTPERQWRVALTLLRLAIEDIKLANNDTVLSVAEKLAKECLRPVDKDVLGYVDLEHIRASLFVALAFFRSEECTNRLETALKVWTELADRQDLQKITAFDDADEINDWISQLHHVSEYLETQSLSTLQVVVLRLLLDVYEIPRVKDKHERWHIQLQLGLQYLRLGFSEQAGVELMKVRDALNDITVDVRYHAACHVAHVEYYLSIGNLEKCEEHFRQACQAGAFDTSATEIALTGPIRSNVSAIARWSQYLYTKAQFVWLTKPSTNVLPLVKGNVEALQHAWKRIEAQDMKSRSQQTQLAQENTSNIETVRNTFSNMSMRSDAQNVPPRAKESYMRGFTFWQLAPILFRSLLQASSVYCHYGMFQEAMHQLLQAQQLASSLQVQPHLASILTQMGIYNCRSGSMAEGSKCLEKAGQAFSILDNSIDHARYYCSIGYLHHLTKQWHIEMEKYKCAEDILDTMSIPNLANSAIIPPLQLRNPHSVSEFSKSLSIQASKRDTRRKPASKPKSGHKAMMLPTHTFPETSGCGRNMLFAKFDSLRTELSRRKAESVLAQGNTQTSLEVINSMNSNIMSAESRAQQRVTLSKILIKAGLTEVSLDAIYSMLPESTISFPAITITQSRRSSAQIPHNISPTKKPQKMTSIKRASKKTSGKVEITVNLLCQAVNNLADISSATVRHYSNSTLLQTSSAFTNATILLSFIQPESVGKAVCPALVAYSIDLPRSIASMRERNIATTSTVKHDFTKGLSQEKEFCQMQYPSPSFVQSDIIDVIPELWTVVSISMDESQEHLYTVRYQAHRDPFILRLPLTRQNAENPDDDTFTFSEARAELREIIEASDASVHAAQEDPDKLKVKGAKTSWWAAREALDERLKNLLINMENVWLGGFRGIFSQGQPNSNLLARFQQSFEIILEKHLPSRQNVRGRTDKCKVQLAPRIFELFIGLGSLPNEIVDLDEALTDLLYYVVDILQFNGECNAYDEIDFDAIIVETQDALHSYYETAIADDSTPAPGHTILILDKQLHAFPWESMPCLALRSVSRVSSLYDLHERISNMKQQHLQQNHLASTTLPTGILVSPRNGTYILNPSTDLTKTQSRFEPTLSALSTTPNAWSSIIARAPTEVEFATALKPSPSATNILLYFGHGSGAQYIRPRHIKRLASASHIANDNTQSPPIQPRTTCNTALLFGCSSASLHTPGEFNNYGPPITYLIAGAPAVLGSLWDVTDGDCDVFAAATLEGWGLIPTGNSSIASEEATRSRGGTKGKGKRKEGASEVVNVTQETPNHGDRWGQLCLSEAAARARTKCYLKYLNGAAMVVYGVPVFLATE